jgi:hypothetical protein
MQVKWWSRPGLLFGIMAVTCMTIALSAEPPESQEKKPQGKQPSPSEIKADERARVTIEVARDRAQIMQEIYASTLNVMHERYFHGDRAVVPARAMKDIFSDIKRQSRTQAKWISVNMNAMNIDHEPASDFEKHAAKEIAAGKTNVEMIEDGYYRLASAIRLTDGCIKCHETSFNRPNATAKYAGLVISMPVHADVAKEE